MGELHIALLPMVAHGHTIPILDMARLLTSRGVKTTIIATPAFSGPILRARQSGHDIRLVLTNFPPKGSSLPDNLVSLDQVSSPDLLTKFLRALELLRGPVEAILRELRPDCLVSDMFLPWTADSAAGLGIPRLAFYGTSCFSRCSSTQLRRTKPYANLSSDSESPARTKVRANAGVGVSRTGRRTE
ncbi:hypothetical protein C2S51_002511 [Perilla frutescens var. frutescens]|nr:hypothetical protein C2S51_002511 [Perilla frutescens var. frutescens]